MSAVLRSAVGYALAAGVWGVHLALYPGVVAYTLAMAPGARALEELLDEATA